MSNTIAVIATGGTIASTTDDTGARVPTLTGAELVRRSGADPRTVTAVDAAHLDSSSITLADIDALAERIELLLDDARVGGIVLTHGTDSMAETALALDLVHRDRRPVVLTGAQLPADHPGADGPANLRGAIAAANDPGLEGQGVFVHFAGRTLPARGLVKASTEDLDAFDHVDAGPRPTPVPRAALAGLRVPILRAWPGAGGELVRAARQAGADGLVVEALGSGNVSDEMGRELLAAIDAGLPVVVSTSVPRGGVHFDYGGAGGGATLGSQGAIAAGSLTPGQARMALITALASGTGPRELL